MVLTETKASGDETENTTTSFNYPHTTKMDVDGATSDIYILWNEQVTVQLGQSSQPEIYLFVKIPNFSCHNCHFF